MESGEYIFEPLRRPPSDVDSAPGICLGEDERFWSGLRKDLATRLGEVFRRFQETTGLPAHVLVEHSFRRLSQRMPRRAHIALRRRARLTESQRRYLDDFFRLCLGQGPSPEGMCIFHRIMTRSRRWRDVPSDGLIPYIRKAVWQDAPRLRRRWEADGILTGRRQRKEAQAAKELDRSRVGPLMPDEELIRKEAFASKLAVLRRLCETGTERDKKILEFIDAGLSPAEMVESGSIDWCDWQGFQRKARRWLKQGRTAQNTLTSRGHSAA